MEREKGSKAIAMDMDGSVPDDCAQISPKFTIHVLQMLKLAHLQHGLRHGDYTRYRRYCSARLRRLYKSLKFTHGRNRFTRRVVTESTVTDVRFLHMVLYCAERAWSHAMEKRQLPGGPNSRQRVYLLGRLRKAVKWANLFSQLCASKGDGITYLEAEAYASYMNGTLLFEQGRSWNVALKKFLTTRIVYEELGKYGDVENRVLCCERVDELETHVRYCRHKISESNMKIANLLQIDEIEEPELDLFKSKLEAVIADVRSQQDASMTKFHFLGYGIPISNAKIQASISKARELEKELNESLEDSFPPAKKLILVDKILASYHDARSCIRSDVASIGNLEDVKDNLYALDKAVSILIGQQTIKRTQLLATMAKSKLSRPVREKASKATMLQDLVRLYDLLLQNVSDVSDLVSSGREHKPEEVAFIQEFELRNLVFRAQRCFYLAMSYSIADKRTEAYALYCRARSIAENALQRYQVMDASDEKIEEELKAVLRECRCNICKEHAAGIMELSKVPEDLSKELSAVSLTGSDGKEVKYLMQKLGVYESAVGDADAKAQPCIAEFPPPFQTIARNPIILDLAFNFIDFPSLEHKIKKDKKGFISRFWA